MATTPVAARLLADETKAASLSNRLLVLLISRRVAISMLLFAVLVAVNIALGTRPLNTLHAFEPVAACGVALVIFGLAVRSWAAGTLRKYKQLITTGPYALVRNPLYVGSFLMMAGFCTLLGDGWSLLVVFVPMVALYWLAVRDEEQLLAHLFPDQWAGYARCTPRFIPRRLVPTREGWSLDQWRKNGEYNAWFGAGLALLGLEIWFLAVR
jgi:protein-S-isoprenylcysteine O-methyltransferase Ste14